MGLSLWHLLVILLVVLVVFGAGKLPQVMGDLGKGIKNFKSGMDSDGGEKKDPAQITRDDKSDNKFS